MRNSQQQELWEPTVCVSTSTKSHDCHTGRTNKSIFPPAFADFTQKRQQRASEVVRPLTPPHVPKGLLHWLPAGSDKKVTTPGSKALPKGVFRLNWEGAAVVCFDKVKITLTLSVADKRLGLLGMTPGTPDSFSH